MSAVPPEIVTAQNQPPSGTVVVQTQSPATRFVFGCLAAVIIAVVAVFLIGIFGGIAIPNFISARHASQRAACIANLKAIDKAKNSWAADHSKGLGSKVSDADIFGSTLYIREKPGCPASGTYSLNPIGTPPNCSIEGHTL